MLDFALSADTIRHRLLGRRKMDLIQQKRIQHCSAASFERFSRVLRSLRYLLNDLAEVPR